MHPQTVILYMQNFVTIGWYYHRKLKSSLIIDSLLRQVFEKQIWRLTHHIQFKIVHPSFNEIICNAVYCNKLKLLDDFDCGMTAVPVDFHHSFVCKEQLAQAGPFTVGLQIYFVW